MMVELGSVYSSAPTRQVFFSVPRRYGGYANRAKEGPGSTGVSVMKNEICSLWRLLTWRQRGCVRWVMSLVPIGPPSIVLSSMGQVSSSRCM